MTTNMDDKELIAKMRDWAARNQGGNSDYGFAIVLDQAADRLEALQRASVTDDLVNKVAYELCTHPDLKITIAQMEPIVPAVRTALEAVFPVTPDQLEVVKGEHSLFDDFGCEFDDDCYVIRWQSGDGHMDSLTAFRSGKIIATRSPFSNDTPPTSRTFDSLLYTRPPTPASGDQMEVERFDEFWDGWGDEYRGMRQHAAGKWVKYDDHAKAITAANERAERERDTEIAALQIRLRDWRNAHRLEMGGRAAAEALNTTLSEALSVARQHLVTITGGDTSMVPQADQDQIDTALAALPAKEGGHSDEA